MSKKKYTEKYVEENFEQCTYCSEFYHADELYHTRYKYYKKVCYTCLRYLEYQESPQGILDNY